MGGGWFDKYIKPPFDNGSAGPATAAPTALDGPLLGWEPPSKAPFPANGASLLQQFERDAFPKDP